MAQLIFTPLYRLNQKIIKKVLFCRKMDETKFLIGSCFSYFTITKEKISLLI
mgnify:CR=1 FL=1|jgi:hypothetical protein